MTDLSEQFVRTRHRVSGQIDEATPRHLTEHEVLGKQYEVVGPDAKPFLPEMHRASLPADATKDQIAAAEAAGFDVEAITVPAPDAELKATVKAERAKAEASDTDKNGKS